MSKPMHESEARRERMTGPTTPDHVMEGKTLPEQIEGDHAYQDDPPEYDPDLWATHSLTCMVCETEFPAAPGGERRERLNDGKVDVGECPECERTVPVVESSVTLPTPGSGYDDTIHVVLQTSHDDYGGSYTRSLAAFRDDEEAESCADEKREPFVDTRVECVGLNH